MIFSSLSNCHRYLGLVPGLDKAFKYLQKVAASPPEDGRYEIEGERIFAIVATYRTAPRIEKILEGHYNYLDVQYVASGGPEEIHYTAAENASIAEDYDPSTDVVKYDPQCAESVLVLHPGDLALFWPEDAHMPGVVHQEPREVKKIVVKVKL